MKKSIIFFLLLGFMPSIILSQSAKSDWKIGVDILPFIANRLYSHSNLVIIYKDISDATSLRLGLGYSYKKSNEEEIGNDTDRLPLFFENRETAIPIQAGLQRDFFTLNRFSFYGAVSVVALYENNSILTSGDRLVETSDSSRIVSATNLVKEKALSLGLGVNTGISFNIDNLRLSLENDWRFLLRKTTYENRSTFDGQPSAVDFIDNNKTAFISQFIPVFSLNLIYSL